eukprot:TRINITY_DN6080_c1_g1_i2.p1 TRINITY_DN6080_c1_g1~~TRINITY_DN6080_c1_g1_i2.p1  ORF type:complete len:722 (-),score=118.22 TRINITY_DN6080_c1_g1_i2:211-2376(-)
MSANTLTSIFIAVVLCSLFVDVSTTSLGVCYYPTQWPSSLWKIDASRMSQLGLKYVRLAEFSWAVVQPTPTSYNWEPLDQAITALADKGLKVVLGTPTATPPKWLVDLSNDSILPYNIEGQPRKFGSRRHYSFSSDLYFNYTMSIVTNMAMRYGNNPAVVGWQLDNEYGCHSTIRTYDPNVLRPFQLWLRERYQTIDALNQAWGNIFWSMLYNSFEEIELPNLSVTQANPAHWLSFYRFSSDQVVRYNAIQASIVRSYSPGRFITTNFMGFFFDFDAFKLGQDLDFATWDNYPLGFTDTSLGLGEIFSINEKVKYARTGHPDVASFHHDIYRSVGKGKFWIMEQQPGPVNWADHNPSPAPGMVRLWTIEAMAHGADVVSYFRWREAPFAQEQMHSGLNRVDLAPDVGYYEVGRVTKDLSVLPLDFNVQSRKEVAIVFDYESQWVLSILPQGIDYSFPQQLFTWYTACRRLGLDVDFVKPGDDLSSYKLVLVPSQPIISDAFKSSIEQYNGNIIFGARSGSKTSEFQIPSNLAPGVLQDILGIKVTRVESLRPEMVEYFEWNNKVYNFSIWREHLDIFSADIISGFSDRQGIAITISSSKPSPSTKRISTTINTNMDLQNMDVSRRAHYFAFYPTKEFLIDYIGAFCDIIGIRYNKMDDESVRISRVGNLVFIFNYGNTPVLSPVGNLNWIIGGETVKPYDFSVGSVPVDAEEVFGSGTVEK